MKNPDSYICITRLGQECFIKEEARSCPVPPQCTELAPGVVELSGISEQQIRANGIFFACQLLPQPVPCSSQSIKGWAALLLEALVNSIPEETEAWGLQVFDQSTAETGKQHSRARLIEQETVALLKQKRRSLLRKLSKDPSKHAALAQLVLTSPDDGYLSITSAPQVKALSPVISPFRAGYVSIPDDRLPPSRAFKKLREAQLRFGLSFRPGMQCADLGACPGGWTHVLVEAGCRVLAVDRSPLDPKLMRSKQVSFASGDAFSWTPEKALDWLVCDVIAAPEKTAALIERWLRERLCHSLCVTVKFKGSPDFGVLASVKRSLAQHCVEHGGKQLTANKNELTVFGHLAD